MREPLADRAIGGIDSSPITIGRWEAGEVAISMLNLLKLFRVLDKPVCFFLQDLAEDHWHTQWLSKWVRTLTGQKRASALRIW